MNHISKYIPNLFEVIYEQKGVKKVELIIAFNEEQAKGYVKGSVKFISVIKLA